jgi:hypothetical protein
MRDGPGCAAGLGEPARTIDPSGRRKTRGGLMFDVVMVLLVSAVFAVPYTDDG